MNAPLVTIGITAFNAADSIERAVQSALAQAWRPIEIVIVDDASTDATPDLLNALAGENPEIRTIRLVENGGVAAARNRIIEEARGEYLVFFDDDDESDPERIAMQQARIAGYERRYPGALAVCHTARRRRYPDGLVRVEPAMGSREDLPAPAGTAVARRILFGAPLANGYGACPTCSQMARLATFRAVGGFDPVFRRSEDSEFAVRVALAGGHFLGVAEPLVTQYMTITPEKNLAEEYRYFIMVVEKHRAVADNERLYEFARGWIDMKQAWLEGRRGEFLSLLLRLSFAHPAMTLQRSRLALPNLGTSRAFSRFYRAHHG